MTLAEIQQNVKAPKGQFNNFGKYKYRSCEDIVEAVKPVINPLGFALILTDEVVNIGGRFYIKATAKLTNGSESFEATAYAREEESKKGMDGSQVTGAASSYARKYALNGLFAIDDNKDADSTNTHNKEVINDVPTAEERQLLRNLVNSSDLNDTEKESAYEKIDTCPNYEYYQIIQHRLENRQIPYDQVPNPSSKDAARAVKRAAGTMPKTAA